MLYVYFGSDEKKTGEKINAAVKVFLRKAPEAHVERIGNGDITLTGLDEKISAQGLFYAKHIIVFDGVLADVPVREKVFQLLPAMKNSDNIFFIREVKLHPAHERTLAKHAQKVERHDAHAVGGAKKNAFALAMVFARGDTSKTWLEYQRALKNGEAPEALHGMLFWKVKDMLIKKHTHVFNEIMLRRMTGELAELPHNARRNGIELEYALERFLLE